MNKTSLADILKNSIKTTYANYVDIGANGFEIRAIIHGTVNTLTNKADIHFQYKIIKATDAANRVAGKYSGISIKKIAAVFGATNMTFAGLNTKARLLYLPANSNNTLNKDESVIYGKSGLVFDKVWNDTDYAGIARTLNDQGNQGIHPFSERIWDAGTVCEVDMYDVTLVY